MPWKQQLISLSPKPRGCHLITNEIHAHIAPMLQDLSIGLCHLFLQHSSASISINENCDPDVRIDMEMMLNRFVPEDLPQYTHTMEGSDDMPAHVKSSLFGVSLTVPIRNGQLAFGTWQGIWLCEHRNQGGSRKLIITIQGD